MATTEERVEHIIYADSLRSPGQVLSHGERIQINKTWTGKYVGRETADAFKFVYFENEEEDYRITVVAKPASSEYKYSVNRTDGSHRTTIMMEQITNIEVVR